jgi:hypothetical protein
MSSDALSSQLMIIIQAFDCVYWLCGPEIYRDRHQKRVSIIFCSIVINIWIIYGGHFGKKAAIFFFLTYDMVIMSIDCVDLNYIGIDTKIVSRLIVINIWQIYGGHFGKKAAILIYFLTYDILYYVHWLCGPEIYRDRHQYCVSVIFRLIVMHIN